MSTNPYETERLLAEYLLFHFGSADEILPADAPAGMAGALDFAVRTTLRFSPGPVERTLVSRYSRTPFVIDAKGVRRVKPGCG